MDPISNLPPEVRNIIHELITLERDDLSSVGYGAPPILESHGLSSQLRQEYLSTWYDGQYGLNIWMKATNRLGNTKWLETWGEDAVRYSRKFYMLLPTMRSLREELWISLHRNGSPPELRFMSPRGPSTRTVEARLQTALNDMLSIGTANPRMHMTLEDLKQLVRLLVDIHPVRASGLPQDFKNDHIELGAVADFWALVE